MLYITRLLSPPIPEDYSGTESHLIGYAPFLNVLLVGISSIDCVQIFSLHGLVGQTYLCHYFTEFKVCLEVKNQITLIGLQRL